jgi:peptidoglycan/LPS O-acetylase OafA/YrhL
MPQFSRALRRWDGLRVAAAAATIAFVALLAAFAFAATSVQPALETILAAVALLGIAGCCFLYAWRDPGR